MSSDTSDDDEDYAHGEPMPGNEKRYPIHDCCEFEDAETLRVSPMVDCTKRNGRDDQDAAAVR
jgi:hypothetical protein